MRAICLMRAICQMRAICHMRAMCLMRAISLMCGMCMMRAQHMSDACYVSDAWYMSVAYGNCSDNCSVLRHCVQTIVQCSSPVVERHASIVQHVHCALHGCKALITREPVNIL